MSPSYAVATAARGASAISTKPRVVMTLEEPGGDGSYRLQRIVGNSLPRQYPLHWEVCSPDGPNRGIFYWKLVEAPSEEIDEDEVEWFVAALAPGRSYSQEKAIQAWLSKPLTKRSTPKERDLFKVLLRRAGELVEVEGTGKQAKFRRAATVPTPDPA